MIPEVVYIKSDAALEVNTKNDSMNFRVNFITPSNKRAKNRNFYCWKQDFRGFVRELRKFVSGYRKAEGQGSGTALT